MPPGRKGKNEKRMKKAAHKGGFGSQKMDAGLYILFQGHSAHLAWDTATLARRRIEVSS